MSKESIPRSNSPGQGSRKTLKTQYLTLKKYKKELKATLTRYRTNFRPAERFDQTFCIHETVLKFRSVQMELITG